ncbi:MAG: response regulator transcription factor [Culicoidibacterales bacterium]
MRILIIEDEEQLATAMAVVLEKANYTVDICLAGDDGLQFARTNLHDLIICDLMLPFIDGQTIIRTLRAEQNPTPILILTAKNTSDDTIRGLDLGADDYLTKPFHTGELLARLRALSRRSGQIIPTMQLTMANITFDPQTLRMSTNSAELQLTLKEAQIFEMFLKHQHQILSKDHLLEKVWGYDSEAEANHVEVYISFLRKKLHLLVADIEIKTVRGLGYILENKQ